MYTVISFTSGLHDLCSHPLPLLERRTLSSHPLPLLERRTLSSHPLPLLERKTLSSHPLPLLERRTLSSHPLPLLERRTLSSHPLPLLERRTLSLLIKREGLYTILYRTLTDMHTQTARDKLTPKCTYLQTCNHLLVLMLLRLPRVFYNHKVHFVM